MDREASSRRPVPANFVGWMELRHKRKPRLLLRLSGLFLLRFAERQFLALLFQLPPRFTRFEPMAAWEG